MISHVLSPQGPALVAAVSLAHAPLFPHNAYLNAQHAIMPNTAPCSPALSSSNASSSLSTSSAAPSAPSASSAAAVAAAASMQIAALSAAAAARIPPWAAATLQWCAQQHSLLMLHATEVRERGQARGKADRNATAAAAPVSASASGSAAAASAAAAAPLAAAALPDASADKSGARNKTPASSTPRRCAEWRF
jgi:hypothetical protein